MISLIQSRTEKDFQGFLQHSIEMAKAFQLVYCGLRPQIHSATNKLSGNKNDDSKKIVQRSMEEKVAVAAEAWIKNPLCVYGVLVSKKHFSISLKAVVNVPKTNRMVSSGHMLTKKRRPTLPNQRDPQPVIRSRPLSGLPNRSTSSKHYLVQ